MSFKEKYLKYKSKYLKLVKYFKQNGSGCDFSWFLNKIKIDESYEVELEEQYKSNTNQIIFKDNVYDYVNSNFINGDNKLTRLQKITITEDELILFEALNNCVNTNNLDITLRVAGGWVRDKIIGHPNDDIDIAIDKISGKQFCEDYLYAYINNLGNNWSCKKPSVIAANDDKSKHLETITLKIKLPNGKKFELDFVNLRKEVYNEDSRIPNIKEATVEEDASRRDLTINALFYNINTKVIEDYVGGIRDIKQKIIRTPINPYITLRDDPLRILRILRFLSRFQFTLDDNIRQAIQTDFIKAGLEKISKERIGQEIEGFFKGSSIPYIAFKEIYENGLWDCIFGNFDFNWGKESIELLKLLQDTSKITVLATLTLPLARIDKDLHVKEKITLVKKVYLENLRLNKEICSISETIHKCIFSIMDLPTDKHEWKRSDIALIHYYAGKYFSNALNIINIIDTTLPLYILKYIDTYNITNVQVDDFIKKFKGNIIMEKFNDTSVMKQIDIDKKCLGILLKKLLIWNLDNLDGTFDDAVTKFKEVDLIKEIVIPSKNNKPVSVSNESRIPNKKSNEPHTPNVIKWQIDFITKDSNETITYDLHDTVNIKNIIKIYFDKLENLICLDLHGVADLYSNEENIPGILPKCIISYIRGRPETILKSTKTMKFRLDNNEILLGIIVYNKDEKPILGTKGWFISQIIDINKNIKINFIDDAKINVECVESVNSPNIISHFIDKSKSPKKQLNSILSRL